LVRFTKKTNLAGFIIRRATLLECLQVTSVPDQTAPSHCNLMKAASQVKRSVTPDQAMKILNKHGHQANLKEAEKVLDLIYFLAKLVVNQNFKA
jgi:hypothetical protein